MGMKEIIIKNRCVGSGIKYIGWSGRGWVDGGPIGAGPIYCKAPSWESYGKEIGINMMRMGFSMKHFLPDDLNDSYSLSEYVIKGMENVEVSWAKSEHTSYSYCIKRCHDLSWKILICVNPSLSSNRKPSLITRSSDFLIIWEKFCFYLAKIIEENWPGMANFFEITNEPDIGYFDGETSLPGYKGTRKGITPFQYCLLLQNAYKGIKKAVPNAKIIGPGLASWDQKWIKEILMQSGSYLNGISYHNVMGNFRDMETLKEARELLLQYVPQSSDIIFNSEWAWWPNHDTDNLEVAIIASRTKKRKANRFLYFDAEFFISEIIFSSLSPDPILFSHRLISHFTVVVKKLIAEGLEQSNSYTFFDWNVLPHGHCF